MRKIYMIGDSIMQTNLYDKYPQTGWGQMLSLFVCDDVEVVNLAKNGTSTKSFIEQKRFEMVENNIKNDDLLIIGFAHNDEKIQDENRYTNPKTKFNLTACLYLFSNFFILFFHLGDFVSKFEI